jgi:hypothetical protein
MAKEKKSNAGRPPIQLKDLPEGWKETILNLSKQGASIVELAVELEISRDTFYALSEREEEFFDTVKRCKELCESWWLRKGRTELENKDFSFTGWYMNMKNRFGWADKTENKNENVNFNSAPMSKEEIQDIAKGLEEDY